MAAETPMDTTGMMGVLALNGMSSNTIWPRLPALHPPARTTSPLAVPAERTRTNAPHLFVPGNCTHT
eukprot:7890197-Pyramimonas_sp.AAC.1